MSERRQNMLANLRADGRFDVIVVGGGVNGIGVYRELSLQGLRVLLVERNDFCSGCSAAPSRMIHGGLRYLENGEFGLVKESLQERDALLQNAPHFVRPLPTVIPITSVFSGLLNAAVSFLGGSSKPSNRGAVPIKLGLALYDWVTRKNRLVPPHKFLSANKSRKKWPALTEKAKYTATYYDAWISHPERLCIEMINDVSEIAPDCVALNYAEITPDGEGFEISCQLTGEKYSLSAGAVVNATGAWLDSTVNALGVDAGDKLVSGTKGSHLIVDNPGLRDALAGHMVYFENTDGRVCIAFPYQGHVLAGSTDIRVDAATKVRCEKEELSYILESLQQVFPTIPVTSEQVVFSYSGIRPLPKSEHGFTGRISRGHFVRRLEGSVPQFCMVGGKWTTFRAFAEQTADEVMQELDFKREIGTHDIAIGGGRNFTPNGAKQIENQILSQGMSRERATHLIDRYGSNALIMNEFCVARPDDTSIGEGVLYSKAEITNLIRNEYVATLSDIVLRRTDLGISGTISSGLIECLCDLLAKELGLTNEEINVQRKSLVDELTEYYGVSSVALKERSKKWSKLCA